ncbi:MAG: RimJ/RimL family protein N-acetyltransferase [Psychrosphaera sp.]|jgi:RimJ/RimL family protein N-acetyltransferase
MDINPSERLSYKLMTEQDAPLLFELDQDVKVMRYINGGKKSTMDDIKHRFIPRLNSFSDHQQGWGLWQVNVTQTNQFIGWILVRPMSFFSDSPELDNLELGWRFKKDSWGQGYATEAAVTVKQALINSGYDGKFSAIADPDNVGSINIMKKIGMQFIEKTLHKDPLGVSIVVYYQCDS